MSKLDLGDDIRTRQIPGSHEFVLPLPWESVLKFDFTGDKQR